MDKVPPCPNCSSLYVYSDNVLLICPECAYEWNPNAEVTDSNVDKVVKDANGNTLQDGDSVSVIKDLKIRGTSSVVKMGTKVKHIRIVEGDHNIDCKVPGIGDMKLKSEFVKKL